MRIVALDIGGTVIKSGIIDDGKLSLKIKTPANSHLGGPYIIETAKKIIAGYTDFNAIGISTAGQVDSEKGLIRYSNQNILDYTGMKIQEILQSEFNVPVAVENDVNAVAIGEVIYGAGLNFEDKNFLCLTYGTGVGGAIVINREVFKGASFSAGEFGHIITHANKEDSGYYEKYSSVRTLVKNMQAIKPELDSGQKIFANIENPAVKEIVDEWIIEIIYGLASLIHVFNPSLIILGGGVMQNNYIINSIREKISNYIMPGFADVKIVQAELGNDAGLWGAGHLASLKL
jgi:predicted NBD/HSP70 family sugar kinase